MRGAAAGFLALIGAALPALSQQVPQVLTLDQDRMFADSMFGRAITARIEAAAQNLASENRRIEAELEAEERELTDQRPTMEPAAFRALGTAFDAKAERLREEQAAKGRALSRDRDEQRQRFLQAAVPVLADLMGEMGALVILDQAAIVLSFDRIDVTDAAIARLDQVLGDGSTLTEPAPALPSPTAVPASP